MRITPSICLVATKTRDVKTYTSETPILTIHDQGLPLRGAKETRKLTSTNIKNISPGIDSHSDLLFRLMD